MYAFKSMVHGYHVYQEMWVADVGEELSCVKETENHQDPFSVADVYQEMWVADVGEELSCVKETENHQDPFSVAVLSIYMYAHTCMILYIQKTM